MDIDISSAVRWVNLTSSVTRGAEHYGTRAQ